MIGILIKPNAATILEILLAQSSSDTNLWIKIKAR